MKIGSRNVSPLDPALVVAEIGLNHNGNPALAHQMIDVAADCGVDAVKLQKREAAACLTRAALAAPYTGRNSFGATYGEHRAALELQLTEWDSLRLHAQDRKLIFFGSAFDVPSLLAIAPLVAAIKIPSCDLTHRDLLYMALEIGLPIILSTGMATEEELDRAIDTLHPARARRQLVLLHCVSGYPVENADANLRRMEWLQRYAVPVGYSDHTRGIVVSVAAVALGACVIEKHFTMDRAAVGPDHAASLEPEGLRRLVRDIRKVEAALSATREQPLPCEMASKKKLRKCAVAARPLPAGHMLQTGDLAYRSPEAEGAVPADHDMFGRRILREVAEDEPIMLANLWGFRWGRDGLDKLSTTE